MNAESPALPEDGVPAEATGLVAHAAGDVRIEAVPVRPPAPHEVVLEVVYGGICGSDLHYWKHGAAGLSVLQEPMLLGHEIVAVVQRTADDGSGPAPGTPVAVHPARPGPGDGSQRYPADRPNLSPGCTYLGSAAHRPHTQGGFARYLTISAQMLRPLPAGLPLRTAAVAEPAGVAVITHEYPVDEAHAALATAADPVLSGKVLLRFADPSTHF
ncbi:MAG: alcohol dehydrogenase catalytic domain-containing protein [Pseudonocardia sp.]|nr:alcohol dehydrogenase catalytic domain-containing protein [Pseudonocardia sp.]